VSHAWDHPELLAATYGTNTDAGRAIPDAFLTITTPISKTLKRLFGL